MDDISSVKAHMTILNFRSSNFTSGMTKAKSRKILHSDSYVKCYQ